MNWFIGLFFLFLGLCIIRAQVFIQICLTCSKNLYTRLLYAVFAAPINTYFDITPIGRILNRFSQDLDAVDTILPDNFLQNLQNGFFVLSAFVMCIVVTPYFIILLVPVIYFIMFVQDHFRRSSRELKRLDRVTRSPLFSLFGESLQGLFVIRAFNKVEYTMTQTLLKTNANMKHFFHFWMSNRWLAIRIDCVSGLIFLAVAVASVIVTKYGGNIDPNYVGLVFYIYLFFLFFLFYNNNYY